MPHNGNMRVTVLGGGTTHGQFMADLARISGSDVELSTIVPTTNDLFAFGLKVCPDLDAILATFTRKLGDATNQVGSVLRTLEVEPTWLELDDTNFGINLVRNEMMLAGYSLTDVTAAIAKKLGIEVAILPMSNERIEQHIVIEDSAGQRAIHVLDYLANHADENPIDQVFIGMDAAVATPEAISAITTADLLIIGPSSPTLHIDPMLRLPSLYKAIHDSTVPVLGVSHKQRDNEKLRELAGGATDPREHFSGFVTKWASGTAAEVLAAGRELIR